MEDFGGISGAIHLRPHRDLHHRSGERRRDAVAGNVADQDVENIVVGRDEPEITPDGSRRLVVRFNTRFAPLDAFRREALLHLRSEPEVFFDFPLALFEQ